MSDNGDLAMLPKLVEQSLAEAREIRRELADMRQRGLLSVEVMRRMETRLDAKITGVRDDVEWIIKSGIMGSRAHLETTLQQTIEALADRLRMLETA